MNSKRPKWLVRVLLATSFTLIGLAAAEIVCLITMPQEPPIRFRQQVSFLNWSSIESWGSKLRADPECFWRFAPNSTLQYIADADPWILSNGQGLREDHEIPLPKPENELRVLFLGDSCTFGLGIGLEETFVEFAEDSLAGHFPGRRVECINAGVPGYSSFQGWRFLETEGFDYDPDVVVACFGTNDRMYWDGRSDLEHYAERRQALAASRLFQIARAAFARLNREENEKKLDVRLSPDEFRGVLSRLLESTQQRDIPLLLVVWAKRKNALGQAPRNPLHEAILEFADTNSVPVVDLLPVFRSLCDQHSPKKVYLDWTHTTGFGNAAVADSLVTPLETLLSSR